MIAAVALAAALTLDAPCDYGPFFDRTEAVTLYRVKAPGRTRFLSGWSENGEDCTDDAPCAQKAYLVTGDVVAVSHLRKGRLCAWFKPAANRKTRGARDIDPARLEAPSTMGWLPVAALEPVAVPRDQPAAAWDGEWVGEWQLLDIRPRGQTRLKIDGVAIYTGNYEVTGSVNTGDLSGLFFRDGDTAEAAVAYDEDARRPTAREKSYEADRRCAGWLRLVGPYLFVVDNQVCGGLNVSFTGLYRR